MSVSQAEAVTGEFSGKEEREMISEQRAQIKHKAKTALETTVTHYKAVTTTTTQS